MPKAKPTCQRKTKNSWSPLSQSGGWKARRKWRKEFVEKMGFEPGVEERSNGWWQW